MFSQRQKLIQEIRRKWISELFLVQVLKVCANHNILPDMKIDVKSQKEAKILTWIAMDFSEEEGAMQKFSCRFKTEGIAAEFKVNVNAIIFLKFLITFSILVKNSYVNYEFENILMEWTLYLIVQGPIDKHCSPFFTCQKAMAVIDFKNSLNPLTKK